MKKHYELARENVSFYGSEESSIQNMLAVLIGPKADPSVTGQLSSLGIHRLIELNQTELMEYEGIGKVAADRIVSAFGLINHVRKHKEEKRYAVRSPEDAAGYLRDMEGLQQEHFDVIFLNTKNEIIGRKNIFKGSLNASIVHPRETFKEAVKLSAASIIVAHNHPSGTSFPSQEDVQVTKRLVNAGKMIGIEVLDHIIIGSNGKFTSLREKGYL